MALAEETRHEHPRTAVILVTGEDDPEVADRAFALGIHGYLIEPLQAGQLLITVINALRWREMEIGKTAHARNLQEQFETIIDAIPIPIPIYAKDAAGRYAVANAKADALAGVGRGEAIGKTDFDLMGRGAAAEARAGDLAVLRGRVAVEADEEMLIDGVERTFHSIKFPLLDETGGVVATGGLAIDITAQREALRLRDELTAAQGVAIEELRLSREETVERLVRDLSRHDPNTGEHIVRIGRLAARLGRKLGLAEGRIELLRVAAPMHDVGKIGTPAEILRKPGPLDRDERDEVEHHAGAGHEILAGSQSELLRMAATISLTHHERYVGSGYPHVLRGEEIPIEGRITAVAGVFDALLSERPYRAAMPLERVLALIGEGRGTQFDPAVVDALFADLDGCTAIVN
jgi:response regulator RpfG family c-di-GMP phosphodiesterase